ncbi:Conserved_hypothetical protein [Hexamita inflata]|uniref:Uncharacterized protein n=1 Tax=Hexamita inflata TaxID=28002 RepID=A0AA86P9R1_9EUKA|nr:Conserved hypothetical protein [Hexamita inflata]
MTTLLLQQLQSISQQLDDLQREKMQSLTELARLQRRQQYLKSALESPCVLSIAPYHPAETSAQAYAHQPVLNYIQDRHGQTYGHLSNLSAGTRTLNQLLREDNIQAFNGFQPRFQSDISGLGGIFGPKLDFGARIQIPQNSTRFNDEFSKPVFSGLVQKKDQDYDFSRVNFTQLKLQAEPWTVQVRKLKGNVPVTRVIQEEPLLREQHRLVKLGTELYDGLVVDEGFNTVLPLNIDKQEQIQAQKANLKEQCLQNRKEVRNRIAQTDFQKDLEYVKEKLQKNKPQSLIMSQTEQWTKGQTHFKKMFYLMAKAVRNYGAWEFIGKEMDAKGLDVIDMEMFRIKGNGGK